MDNTMVMNTYDAKKVLQPFFNECLHMFIKSLENLVINYDENEKNFKLIYDKIVNITVMYKSVNSLESEDFFMLHQSLKDIELFYNTFFLINYPKLMKKNIVSDETLFEHYRTSLNAHRVINMLSEHISDDLTKITLPKNDIFLYSLKKQLESRISSNFFVEHNIESIDFSSKNISVKKLIGDELFGFIFKLIVCGLIKEILNIQAKVNIKHNLIYLANLLCVLYNLRVEEDEDEIEDVCEVIEHTMELVDLFLNDNTYDRFQLQNLQDLQGKVEMCGELLKILKRNKKKGGGDIKLTSTVKKFIKKQYA
jgi:hypothetical protein